MSKECPRAAENIFSYPQRYDAEINEMEIDMNFQDAQMRAASCYYRAKADYDRLDGLSRQRSLTEQESRMLESAINRMAEYGAIS